MIEEAKIYSALRALAGGGVIVARDTAVCSGSEVVKGKAGVIRTDVGKDAVYLVLEVKFRVPYEALGIQKPGEASPLPPVTRRRRGRL